MGSFEGKCFNFIHGKIPKLCLYFWCSLSEMLFFEVLVYFVIYSSMWCQENAVLYILFVPYGAAQ